ncbi:hypothetical protein DYB32_005682 [Aphanomyces invadans]|uniref:Uncharacterized protein n=1 Tax=Aphanomyces invadans TaxID=157072 RepID=A0A3R6VKL4_9STRA|nr:hypothetical protein DYB32_005682 [Aphanomyces invadans]
MARSRARDPMESSSSGSCRCFPHCCPTHMLNSTCGTSVMMQIAGQFSPTEALSFVTFARFETTMDPPSFHVGNCVPFAEFADSDSKSSPWYPGALSTNSADNDVRPCSNTLCFPHCCPEHNLHCSCGGPIAVAVDMTHPIEGEIVMYAHGERVDDAEFALNQVAYVFQLSPDNTALRVLNWIASTPFTMSSFRRSNTTPTSRTNKYIQVIPTEITDQSLQVLRKKVPASRKRQHDHVESPTTLLNEINSAG